MIYDYYNNINLFYAVEYTQMFPLTIKKKKRICSDINSAFTSYVNRFVDKLSGNAAAQNDGDVQNDTAAQNDGNVQNDTVKQSCIECISQIHQIYLYNAGYYYFYFIRVDDNSGVPINLPDDLYRDRKDEINEDISTLFPKTINEIASAKTDEIVSHPSTIGPSCNIDDMNWGNSLRLRSRRSILNGLNLLTEVY